jgi:alkaline phosphatase D
MTINRREFLGYVALIGGCKFDHGFPSVPPDELDASPPLQSPESDAIDMVAFPFGVMAGDMEATGVDTARAIVWTRCLGNTLSLIVWERASNVIAFESDVAIGVDGFTHVDVTTLRPHARYRYQFRSGDGYSVAGELVTPPAPGSLQPVTFGAVACTHQYGEPGYQAIAHAANESLDCFFHLGDHVYNDAETWLTTLAQFRASWQDCFELPYMRQFHATHGVYFTWDDHEILNNWDLDWIDANPQYRGSVRYGTQTYFEHHPIRRNPTAPDRLWRSIKWGATAEFFVLDLRGERHEDTNRRIMSREQMRWLTNALANSTAVFKFVMNPIPVCTMPASDAHRADRWEGFASDRDELLGFIRDRHLENVWWISGDYHVGAVGQIERYGYRWYGMREVMMGPGAGHGAAEAEAMAAYVDPTSGEKQWPYVTQASNYVTIAADPDTMLVRVQFRAGDGTVIHDQTYDAVYKPVRMVAGIVATKHTQYQAQLGEALTNKHSTQGTTGSWQQFQYGYVFTNGGVAYAIYGRILDYWANAGWSQSWLGFPTSDPYTTATGATEQAFEHGYVTFNASTGIITTRAA